MTITVLVGRPNEQNKIRAQQIDCITMNEREWTKIQFVKEEKRQKKCTQQVVDSTECGAHTLSLTKKKPLTQGNSSR